MTREEAREILQVYRPNGSDVSEVRFSEALRRLESDSELARWFEEQKHFDAAIAQSLNSVPVPSDLKASILLGRSMIRLPLWHDWRVRAAVAASIALLAVAAAARLIHPARPFSDFRQQLVEQAWGGSKHLDFESSDWKAVRTWLAGHNLETNFALPPALTEVRLHGCNVVSVDGHKVPVICLADGPKHLHLFVVSGVRFPDLVQNGLPDFEKCNGWKTASWQQRGKTFVLTGMSYQTFVNKFRKAGRWTISG